MMLLVVLVAVLACCCNDDEDDSNAVLCVQSVSILMADCVCSTGEGASCEKDELVNTCERGELVNTCEKGELVSTYYLTATATKETGDSLHSPS